MGLLRDWIRGTARVAELEAALASEKDVVNEQRRELSLCLVEQQRLRERASAAETKLADVQRSHGEAVKEAMRHQGHIDLLHELIDDARKREVADAGLVARLVTVERHNATYQATTQWAVAHINSIAIERGSLIDRLDDRRGIHPVPQFQLESPDVAMAPPPGPIGNAPSIMGRPLAEGQSAGDVINALRAKREREGTQQPISADEMVKAVEIRANGVRPEPVATLLEAGAGVLGVGTFVLGLFTGSSFLQGLGVNLAVAGGFSAVSRQVQSSTSLPLIDYTT